MRATRPEWCSILHSIERQAWLDQCAAIRQLADNPADSADIVLLRLLDNRSPRVREEALQALAKRDKTYGRVAARAMLEDSSGLIRNAAAEMLGAVGTRLDARRLRNALDDPDWVVRASAADSLGRVGGRAAHPALIGVLRQDAHPVVRRDAAYALAFAADDAVAPVLEGALDVEQSEQARVGLLAALYALGQRGRLPDLLALLRSDDHQVRYAAMNVIEEVVLPPDRAEAVRSLREMLQREESPGLQVDAGHTLARLEAAAP